MPFCAALSCGFKSSVKSRKQLEYETLIGGKICFHKFPKDPDKRTKWTWLLKRPNWEPNEHSFLCSKHFVKEDYEEGYSRNKLKEDAMPSVFLDLPEHLQAEVNHRFKMLSLDQGINANIPKPIQASMKTQPNLTCRLCAKVLSHSNKPEWLYRNGKLTILGLQLNIILNEPGGANSRESVQCCKFCASKIKSTFSMLLEIKAMGTIVSQLHNSLCTSNKPPDAGTFVFECCECMLEVQGLLAYIQHYEKHLINRNIEGNEVDLASLRDTNDVELNTTHDNEDKSETENIGFQDIFQDNFKQKKKPAENLNNHLSDFDDDSDDELYNVVTEELNIADDTDIDEIFLTNDAADNELHKCTECNVQFNFKFELRAHLHGHHDNQKSPKILTIRSEFRNEEKLKKCRFCQEMISVSDYKKHTSECELGYKDRTVLCSHCGKIIRAQDFVRHSNAHNTARRRSAVSESLNCDLCSKKFNNMYKLKKHTARHSPSEKIICEICGKYLIRQSIHKHRQVHNGKHRVCNICGRRYLYQNELEQHLRSHAVRDECQWTGHCKRCDIFFSSALEYNKHILDVHKKGSSCKKYQCPLCDTQLATIESMILHKQKVHNRYDCQYCQHTFEVSKTNNSHLSECPKLPLEQLDGYFKCKLCGHSENMFDNIIRHFERKHHPIRSTKPRTHKSLCQHCKQSFASTNGLKVHINSVHLNIRNKVCKDCGKTYKNDNALIQHQTLHTGAKNYKCEVCHKRFRISVDAKRHLHRHVQQNEVPLEDAALTNTSDSLHVRKRRIFLKDSNMKIETKKKKQTMIPQKF